MTPSQYRRDENEGVVTITFTRDEKRNAISPEIFAGIEQAARDLAERDDLRVLVITAEGRYFSAGIDITSIPETLGLGTDGVARGSNMRYQYRRQARHDFYDLLESIEKPIVHAAQAPCLGTGLEMAVSCDFRLASERTTYSLPEIQNIGMIPGSGGISRLTRLVGPHWAKWLAMAGEVIDAQEAKAMGLVHAVYPEAEFPARVQGFARRLAGLPREALGVAKLAVDACADVDRRTARDVERIANSLLMHDDAGTR